MFVVAVVGCAVGCVAFKALLAAVMDDVLELQPLHVGGQDLALVIQPDLLWELDVWQHHKGCLWCAVAPASSVRVLEDLDLAHCAGERGGMPQTDLV